MTEAPSCFSKANPKLQYAWDSTSFRALMQCPRYYEYSIIKGYKGSTIDLEFGIIVHGGVEEFTRRRLDGDTKEQATLAAVKWTMLNSGEYHDGVFYPWGGTYEEQWRCLGTEKYKNAKGNPAKCPWSHKGKWHIPPAPGVCGECGSETETVTRWLATDTSKDRFTALRLVAWYCFEEPDDYSTGLVPYKFPDGNPAVEVSFRLPLPYKTPEGENYILCGHLDKMASYEKDMFVADLKTTKKTLSKAYWGTFAPNIQMDVYDLASNIMFPELKMRGIVIEGAQTLVGGARFGKQVFYRTEAQREEVLNELGHWLKVAEGYAEEDYWPMNRSGCWLCQFKGVCSKDPDQRERYLEADFKVEHWNPLEER